MFSGGESYERFMGRWSRELAPRLLEFSGLQDGAFVLDVGAGTGSLAATVASTWRGSRVIGVDPSATYVAYAQAHRRSDRIDFEVGDAQALDFASAIFDRTLALLVMNFIPDAPTALAEMVRVTRPGGVVAAAVWDYGEDMEMLRVFWDEAVALDPEAEARDERHMPLCRSGELARLWRTQGLLDVVEEPLVISLVFMSFDDLWVPFLAGQGPAGAYLASQSEAHQLGLRTRIRRRVLPDGEDGPIILRGKAWAVKGVVPER